VIRPVDQHGCPRRCRGFLDEDGLVHVAVHYSDDPNHGWYILCIGCLAPVAWLDGNNLRPLTCVRCMVQS
jgi:hypothetical protein